MNLPKWEANWLRCLGDYCTECDGSQRQSKTICDCIIELNAVFDDFNSEKKPAKPVGFKISQFIYIGKELDKVLKAVKDYHTKLVEGDVEEVIPLGFWQRASDYQWLEGMRLEHELNTMNDVSLTDLDFPPKMDGHETKTVHDLERWIRDGISELKTLLRTIRGIIADLPLSCYGKIYESQMEYVDAEPVKRFFDWWKMRAGKLTFENLKALHTMTVTDFVNSDILRFAAPAIIDEIGKLELEKVKKLMPAEYEYSKDFESHAAIFKRWVGWDGNIMHLDKGGYGQYICQNILEFTPEERMALYQFEKLLKFIHKAMLRLPPEERKKVLEEKGANSVLSSHSESRQRILKELCALADKGDWAKGVTPGDVKTMLYNVLNMGETPLADKEAEMSELLWQLLENGRGDRVKIVWQNMVGYLDDRKTLKLKGGPALNKDFFGTEESYSNIDKGRPSRENCSSGFRDVIPLLDSYVPKV